MKEFANHNSILKINKFVDKDGTVAKLLQSGKSIEEIMELFPDRFLGEERHEGNILVNVGIQGLWKLACGLSSPPGAWSNANAKIRVGTGTGSASASDTAATFTSPVDKAMDTGYPQLSGQTISFKATYGSGDANQAWNEFGVINSDATPVLLNRFVTSKGTKSSGETWSIEIQITLS
jgi:hypothetical protein